VTTRLTDTLAMLSGPGGNVLVLSGSDGKIVVDTFVQPAWPDLKRLLQEMHPAPVQTVIDTHWHFDHADNNDGFRKDGAIILAHANTPKRMSETHVVLGMEMTPVAKECLPTQTFTASHTLTISGERIEAKSIPPAHTDTDISVHFTRANVLHLGDVYFNELDQDCSGTWSPGRSLHAAEVSRDARDRQRSREEAEGRRTDARRSDRRAPDRRPRRRVARVLQAGILCQHGLRHRQVEDLFTDQLPPRRRSRLLT
jgi:glyoxylase-like metal-dependent hydrolase (beta-lactamase superfamily II)